ncbi:uncharacterized protein PV07_00702 [Cladophialophora immunda]|uniref:DNA-directed RNA polymerase III subunit RPC4 n=1 Tax=Cladophialophora immunda TaxID=569365 RepID=A0A0D2B8C0_9EURO|nr:uncharacterized protein PV07_00702 [Cladophialophora immunda]KIW33887.1 hypothetical protein PV07_00702 [Cladophialophora immunda]
MPDETPSTPPTASARSTPRGGAARPRPRAGIQRKTKAEREQFAKEEAERQKARAAEHGVANRGARGARATSRGGRGSAAAGQREEPVGGGGVFGAGSGARLSTKPRTSYEGYTELLESGLRDGPHEDAFQDGPASGRGTRAGQTGSGRPGTSAGGKADVSWTGEALDAAREEDSDDDDIRDIEDITISSDDDDDDEDDITSSSRKGKEKATGSSVHMPHRGRDLRPVRAPRIRDEEEGRGGAGARSRSKKSRGGEAQKPDAETQELESKSEQEEDTEDADSESLQFVKEQPSSPEMRKRTLKRQLGAGKIGRDAKGPVTETVEERAERMRAMEDVQKLRNLFISPPATDVKMTVDEEKEDLSRKKAKSRLMESRLFLFQLPPLTPFLVDSTATHADGVGVKVEPTTSDTTTTIDLDAPDERTTGANTASDPEIKADPDNPAKVAQKPALQMEGLLTASEPMRLPEGIVGKLRVHKSGKVTLDWGGTDLEVRYGTEVDFLQDVVLVEPGRKREDADREGEGEDERENSDGDEAEEEEKKDIKGTAYALGPVRRKMVLIPDWVKLYD